MKLRTLLGVLLVSTLVPLGMADMIWDFGPDSDGAIVLNEEPVWNELSSTLTASETQYWWPAHMLGGFDDGADGSRSLIWVRNSVYNDADVLPLVWSDYHINISMNHAFTISNAATLPDWTVSNITQPTLVGSEWIGTVDYLAGTPVNVGDWGQFDVQLSFTGSVRYCLEMIPTPEPAALVVPVLAAAFFARRRM